MELEREVLGDGIVSMRVMGRIDALTAPELEKEVAAVLAVEALGKRKVEQ